MIFSWSKNIRVVNCRKSFLIFILDRLHNILEFRELLLHSKILSCALKNLIDFCISYKVKQDVKLFIHLSLRGAKRRSNPERECWYTGLLRYARNESYAMRTYQVLLCKTCGNDREKMDCHADLYFANAKYGERKKTVIFVLWHEDFTRQSL